MKCNNCGHENTMGAKFCEKCGTNFSAEVSSAAPDLSVMEASDPVVSTPTVAPKKNKTMYIVIASVLSVALLIGGGIWAWNSFLKPSDTHSVAEKNEEPEDEKSGEYEEHIKLANEYLDDGDYAEAVEEFTKAIKLDDTKAEAYYGKATAMANDAIDTGIVEDIADFLIKGYKKTGDDGLVVHMKEVAEILEDNGYEEEAKQMLDLYYMNLTTDIKSADKEEIVFGEFKQAYNFYFEWIYMQKYVEFLDENPTENPARARVVHKEINTVDKLKKAMRKHFSEERTESFIEDFNIAEENGELLMDADIGVGSPLEELVGYSIDDMSDDECVMTVEMMDVGGVDYDEDPNYYYYDVVCTWDSDNWIFSYEY